MLIKLLLCFLGFHKYQCVYQVKNTKLEVCRYCKKSFWDQEADQVFILDDK